VCWSHREGDARMPRFLVPRVDEIHSPPISNAGKRLTDRILPTAAARRRPVAGASPCARSSSAVAGRLVSSPGQIVVLFSLPHRKITRHRAARHRGDSRRRGLCDRRIESSGQAWRPCRGAGAFSLSPRTRNSQVADVSQNAMSSIWWATDARRHGAQWGKVPAQMSKNAVPLRPFW